MKSSISRRIIGTLFLAARTDRAILASHDGDKDKAVWLPLSQIEVEVMIRSGRSFGAAIVTMPEVLAIDKGLAGRSIPSSHGHNGCR